MRTFTTHRLKIFSVLILAGGVMLGGMLDQAQAGDKKVYSGALCQPRKGNTNTTRYSHGEKGIVNLDLNHYLYVECPVTRDNTTTQKGLKEWGFAGTNYSWTQGLIRCTMSSRFYPTAQVVDSKSGVMKYGKPSDIEGKPQTIRIKTGPKKAGKTYLTLTCSIPPKSEGNASYIASYYVHEY